MESLFNTIDLALEDKNEGELLDALNDALMNWTKFTEQLKTRLEKLAKAITEDIEE